MRARKAIQSAALLLVSSIAMGLAGTAPRAANAQARITLGEPRQIFAYRAPEALGLFNVPDMHTALLRQADQSYLIWITGNVGPNAGAIARLSTTDFLHFRNAGPGGPLKAQPVMLPSCRTAQRARPYQRQTGVRADQDSEADCQQNPDANYVGANTVLRAANGRDLLMFYEAGNKSIGTTAISHGWEFNVIARARSSDNGMSWRRDEVILSGSDAKPAARTDVTQPGISEPGAIVADGYIYVFYQYVPNSAADADAPSVVQAARAPLSGDGAAGTWMKYFQGRFSEPGVGGHGSPIVATGAASGCTRPVEVWPAFSTYLNAYVLTFLCNEGWFFSTSSDLVTWAAPANFLPIKMWQPCQAMDWNYILVTPGNEAGVIGQTGYVLYAHSPAKGMGCGGRFSPHMPWIRSFSFEKGS